MNLPQPDEHLLERLLLPLLEEEVALNFVREVAPNLVSALREDVLKASETEEERRLKRLERLRERVQNARSYDELTRLADPLLLPSKVFEPDSALWEKWQRPRLREELREALLEQQRAQELLDAAQPGTFTYPRVKKRGEKAHERLRDVAKDVALAWLHQQEEDLHQARERNSEVEWRAETRLQVPLVVGNRLVDYVDAEITLTLATPQAFITRTFAVAVIPPNMGIIPALRRINLLRHHLPTDVEMIVVVTDPHHLRALQQHGTYVYLAREKDIASDTPPAQ